ncbi:nicotinamide N-methyltransferase-like [Rana temporaria]|uniref:nicotinamide N-methyltransferase-like n=1 Tax=Rana temporaria TaxID=8407 RepID=UPI001AAD9125|nr:nicotinamide N-methyltransferase-like [Rana temporaria]XP_040193095.1 nicotinamide N-methyltransferase-like [Rana temporaria]XP_040193096.1 nicotinamide N-methyltransferase-like [Rana temporaria]XP_040193097.1 nicotinamide N-methyltransferase-like [Rana temporaria]XP_040193098.1 nicotinamide N-methyltransferase-like [Rana temporaria]XP_040193099.1 nicotinamide N-methyltransferase-like [Rana temporaria]
MDFTGGESYLSSFDSKAYLTSFCTLGSQRDDILKFRLKKLYQTFGPGGIRGDVLIDIGTGPTIYTLLSACESFPYIIASDFTDQNRNELKKWLKNDPEAFDWSEIVKTVCEIEGKSRDKWEEKQNKLRSIIQKVLKCDVTRSNPLDPVEVPAADCLITSFCLETACKDLESYRCSIQNITRLLRPGGHLVLIGALGNTYYMVQQKAFSCLSLDEDAVRGAITQAGYTIQSMEILPIPEKTAHVDTADSLANFFLVAKKETENLTY